LPWRHRGDVKVHLYHFLNLAARWEWVVNVTLRPRYPREWPRSHCYRRLAGSRAGLYGSGKSLAHTVIRSSDRSDRNESLYRLRFPPSPQKNLFRCYYIHDENLHLAGHYLSDTSSNLWFPKKVQWLDPPPRSNYFLSSCLRSWFLLYVHQFWNFSVQKACIKLSVAVPRNGVLFTLIRPGNKPTDLRNSTKNYFKKLDRMDPSISFATK